MKLLGQIAGAALAILGIFHLILTSQNYDAATSEALWFMGSGMFLITCGLLTFTAIRSCDRDGLIAAIIANLLGAYLAIKALDLMSGGHVYILLAAFMLGTASAVYRLFPRDHGE